MCAFRKAFVDQDKAVFTIDYSIEHKDCSVANEYHFQKKWCAGNNDPGICTATTVNKSAVPLHNCFDMQVPLPATQCTARGEYSAGRCR